VTLAPDPLAHAPWALLRPHLAEPYCFLLDRAGRSVPSFAGGRPSSQLVVDCSGRVRCWKDGCWRESSAHPLVAIANFVERSRARPLDTPRWLRGRLLPRTVGYLSYELACFIEQVRRADVDFLDLPLAVLSTYDEIDAWDPDTGAISRVHFDAGGAPVPEEDRGSSPQTWEQTARPLYDRGFERIAAAIAAGDLYQANLSRREVFDLVDAPADVYRRLRRVQPVPHGAFLRCGGFELLSNSPECFLERRGDRVRTLPIKGTRARRAEAGADAAARKQLRTDAKERAEHVMIVDLERNDLGRVALAGSVEVARFGRVASWATVHHMISEVRATLQPGTGLAELLRATFPGGSITGAPKIAAIDLLAGVERYTRGPYTGAVGMWNGGAMLELSIAIRTAVVRGGRACYSAGGGIVADSDRDAEWAETEVKLRAWKSCVAQAASVDAVA